MKPAAWAALGALVALLMVPNVALLTTCPFASNFTWAVALLVVPPSTLLGLLLLCGRRLWLTCLLLAPFAAVAPTATFYILHYHTAITEAVLGTVFDSDPAEAAGFLGGSLLPLALLTFASVTTGLLASWLCARTRVMLVLPPDGTEPWPESVCWGWPGSLACKRRLGSSVRRTRRQTIPI